MLRGISFVLWIVLFFAVEVHAADAKASWADAFARIKSLDDGRKTFGLNGDNHQVTYSDYVHRFVAKHSERFS